MKALLGVSIGLLLSVALVPSAQAQAWPDALAGSQWPWSAPQQPHPAVARITVPQRQHNMMAFGSGTLVDTNDKLGLVITNWHVVDEAAGEITVAFPDGFRSGARVLKVDRDWDLAALAVWKPSVKPVALSSQPPRPGDTLTIAGYGQGRYRAASGRCTQYVAPGLNFPYEMLEVAVAARQGDSGGPIFNSSGQLAGVLFGEGGGRTSGAYCRRVHQFLSTIAIPVGGLPPVAPPALAPPAVVAPVRPIERPMTDRPVAAAGPQETWSPAAPTAIPAGEPPAPSPPLPATLFPPPPVVVQPIGLTRDSSSSLPAAVPADRPIADASNRFRATRPQVSSERASSAAAESDSGWRAWIGSDPLEQIKSALAVVGAMALLLHSRRWLRGG
ncbi:MAG TPA: serine protease [Pirellulales bacterium]